MKNYIYKKADDSLKLYEFYRKIAAKIPYWFTVDFEIWSESMFSDTDYEGMIFFKELYTYVAEADGEIAGFIQFGIPNFIFDQSGEKDTTVKAGIIRNLYFEENEAECGRELIKIAEDCFKDAAVEKEFAFFHAFGMTCNAGHGKLYCEEKQIETGLFRYGYVKEHENVYYKRKITEEDIGTQNEISVKYEKCNPKGLCNFSLWKEETYIGAGCLTYLPQGKIGYLKWIYIEDAFKKRGYASMALKQIFANLYQKGIERIDTDTADGNVIAQNLYEKMGFEDMGRTRSYLK